MERLISYAIAGADTTLTVAQFLKKKGYSSANLTDLKKYRTACFLTAVRLI